MIRLHITAEGQTEQRFSQQLLTPHLATFDVFVDARCVLTSKDKRTATSFRGGLVSYEKAKKDIQTWLKEDQHPDCRFTTMFDLYALPNDFPNYHQAQKIADPYQRVALLESAMQQDIADARFIPYIQLHEFEALVLVDPKQLDWEYLEHDTAIQHLISMVGSQNPELINGGVTTAPSKRILQHIPEYDKVTAGVAVVKQIGLARLRGKCTHFNEWLTQLEQLTA